MKNNLLTEQLAYNGDSRTKTHIHLIRYSAGTFEETLLDAFTPEAVAVGADEKIWLRIHGLKDAACIEAVCTHFGADFLTIQDILNADHPSKVEEHDGFNFMVGRIFQSDSAVQVRLMQGEHFVLSLSRAIRASSTMWPGRCATTCCASACVRPITSSWC